MENENEKRAIESTDKTAMDASDRNVKESTSLDPVQDPAVVHSGVEVEEVKKPWYRVFLEPGHAAQIVLAAAIAIGIGMGVSAGVGRDNIPPAAPAILGIPGMLWLRSLQCVVLPMIVCAMILSVQSLREISAGGPILARWTVSYYVLTTILAIAFSIVMTSQIWAPLMPVASDEDLDLENIAEEDTVEAGSEREPHDMAVTLFESLIPRNMVYAFANNELLSIVIASIVIGYLIRPENSSILRVVREVNDMIARVIVFLIKLAPIGVFFLILPNMFRLDVTSVGVNLGYLIGGSVSSMLIHLWVVLPIIFIAFVRKNPWTWWARSSKAWITAWGTASSAATLPLTLRVCRERGVPNTIVDFAVPLGCMINMDGTSIYFPMVVVFMARTQGMDLDAGQYILLLLLSTLSAIGTTPIPSSSLVLVIMICQSLNIPVSGMYAVVVAIDWFIDRFRTMVNVSGDIFAVGILQKVTGIVDPEHVEEVGEVQSNTVHTNEQRV